MKNKRLGEMLVDAGILSEKQIEEAIALQKDSGRKFSENLNCQSNRNRNN